jgi:YD repeat-containing protein
LFLMQGVLMCKATTATETSYRSTARTGRPPLLAAVLPILVCLALHPALARAVPSITSLTPNTGPVGTAVTIAGSGFGNNQGSSTVTFNGVTGTPTNWKQNSITVPVPNGATTGPVVVTVSGSASNGVTFTVTLPPGITSLTPNSGPVGTAVMIAGANFGATQGTSTLKFNGVTATPSSWSTTSITAPVPSGASTGPVVVTVGGTASNGVAFTVTVAPSITTLTPNNGSAGTSVTIAGTNFGATQGTSTVTFNGVSAGPTSWSNTSIVAPVPAFASTGPVVVTVAGTASNVVTFTVPNNVTFAYDELGRLLVASDQSGNTAAYAYDAVGNILSVAQYTASSVAVAAFAPSSGVPGIQVSVYGTGFSTTPSQNTVRFNGVTAVVTAATATRLTTTVPTAATSGPIAVTVAGVTGTSSTTFTVGQPPTITSFTPSVAVPGDALTINGANFFTVGYDDVKVNTTASRAVSATSTTINALVPTAGSGRLTVTTPFGTATTNDLYIAPPPFTIAQINPGASGRVALGGTKSVTVDPGQVALVLMDLTAGQKFSASAAGGGGWRFYDPTGQEYSPPFSPWYGLCDGSVAPTTGTYSFAATDPNATPVTTSIQTYAVMDLSTPITVGGTASLTSTIVGQELRFPFTLSQPMKISMTAIPSYGCTVLQLNDASGPILYGVFIGPGTMCANGEYIEGTLPAGTYTIVAKPLCYTNQQVTTRLYNATDVTGTITINRNGRNFSTTTWGQNVALHFDGTAGQLVTAKVTNLSIVSSEPCAQIKLLSTDGTTELAFNPWCRSDGTSVTLPQVTLPSTGTYTVYVDPFSTGTITFTAAVTSP